jgi:DNA-binding CsgD family transcriptional regulator/tetratricopeptide (TPR) repeat protein
VAPPRALLEREPELDRIDALLAEARRGAGGALMLDGPAGIGKTALVRACRERAARDGMTVLHARAGELEQAYTLGVVRQWLEPVLRDAPADTRRRLLGGAAALTAPILLDAASPVAEATPFAVLHGLYWLVANLAGEAPVVLVLDDAHWADEPSLRFVAFLVRRIEDLPVALVLAGRPGAESRALAEVRADPVTQLRTIQTLSEAGVAALVGADAGEAVPGPFATACHGATGGNPFLLDQLVGAMRDQGVPFAAAAARLVPDVTPPEIARSVRARLERLGPGPVALAHAVAVLGDETTVQDAAALSGLGGSASDAADALARAELLDDARPLRFRHPLLRAAVTANLSAGERGAAHRRAAEILRDRGAPVQRIALHVAAAEPEGDAAAVDTLRMAASRAREQGAPEAAAALLTRALAEPPPEAFRASVLTELGEAEFVAGDRSAAASSLLAAFEATTDPQLRAHALYRMYSATGPNLREHKVFIPRLDAALAALGDRDTELALHLEALRLALDVHEAGPETAQRVSEFAARLTGATPGEACVLAALIFHRMFAGADAEEVGELASRAARHAPELLGVGGESHLFSLVALSLRWSDRLETAETLLAETIAAARREGSALAFATASAHRASVRRRAGRLREAEADARAAIDAAGEDWYAMLAGGSLATILLERGQLDEAQQVIRERGLEGVLPDIPPMTSALLARMQVRAAAGDHERALVDWELALARQRGRGPLGAGWLDDSARAAELLRATGRPTEATTLTAEVLDVARRWNTPGAIGQALRACARIGAADDAVALLEDAVAHLERSPARAELARALADLGGALRRRGDRVRSREPLRAAVALGHECGADGLADAARQELAASGVRLRRIAISGADSLTASERRIAGMAAEGTSNAEIAQSLFVTVKTVEMHLTHAYRKLDINGRAGLVAIQLRTPGVPTS